MQIALKYKLKLNFNQSHMEKPVTKSLELTEQDANGLIRMLDIAVKAQGLQGGVAHGAVVFSQRLHELFAPEQEEVKEVKEEIKEEPKKK